MDHQILALNTCGEVAFRAGDHATAIGLWQASLAHDPLQVLLRDRVRTLQPDAAPAGPLLEIPEASVHPVARASGDPIHVVDHRWREVLPDGRAVTWAALRYTARATVVGWRVPVPAGAEVLEAWREVGGERRLLPGDADGGLRIDAIETGEMVGLRWRLVHAGVQDGGVLGADDPHRTTSFEATLCLPSAQANQLAWSAPGVGTGPAPTADPPRQGSLGGAVRCSTARAHNLAPAPDDPVAADLWVDRPALIYALHADVSALAQTLDTGPLPGPEDWRWVASLPPRGLAAQVAAAMRRAAEVQAGPARMRGLLALLNVESFLARARPRSAKVWAKVPASVAMLPVSLVYVPEINSFFADGGQSPSGELAGVSAWVFEATPRVVELTVPAEVREDAVDVRAVALGEAAVIIKAEGVGAQARAAALTGLFWLARDATDQAVFRRAEAPGAPLPLPAHLRLLPEPAGRTAWLGAPAVHHTRWRADAPLAEVHWPRPPEAWSQAGLALEVQTSRTAEGAVGVRTIRRPGGLAPAATGPLTQWFAAVDALDRAPILPEVAEVPAIERAESPEPGSAADGR